MKYFSIPSTVISGPDSNTWYIQELYHNSTNSYALLMGSAWDTTLLQWTQTEPYWQIVQMYIVDQNGNMVDQIMFNSITVTLQNASIPVWNGTSAVNESGQIPVKQSILYDRIRKTLIPPYFSVMFSLLSSQSNPTTTYVGGWGFFLTDEELNAYLFGGINHDD